MMKSCSFLLALGLVFVLTGPLLAHTNIGSCCSGAPGEPFECLYCHGYPGGTITVRGFPDQYQPGQTYRLTVGLFPGGDSIGFFNCSIKIGVGSVNAGLVHAGYLTGVYSCHPDGLIDGVGALARCDSCDFFWTAPPAGTDTVRLYLGGWQGVEGEWGQYTLLNLASAEAFYGTEEKRESLLSGSEAFGLRPVGANPARGSVALAYRIAGSDPAELRIYDLRGRLVRALVLSGRDGLLRWNGRDV